MRRVATAVPVSDSDLRLCRSIVPKLLSWFGSAARDLPWRRTRDPYAIWVSEIMLQQTQVTAVIGYWERWMKALPNVSALAEAKIETVLKLWEGLGYYRRARNLHQAADWVVRQFGGKFPTEYEAILELPGIGRYTAGAISSIAFNQPQPIVDGNVIRVLTRVFAISGNPADKAVNASLWQLAAELVRVASKSPEPPEAACSHFNQAMMELGALVCTPAAPACERCPLNRHCRARSLKQVDRFPKTKQQVKTTARRYAALVLRCQKHWFVRQRPAEAVNGGFWEFPTIELAGADQPETVLRAWLQREDASLTRLGEITHAITRYRIRQEVYRCEVAQKLRTFPEPGAWVTSEQLEELPLTRAHRRIVTEFLA